jgi:cobalt-zinc-cadmium efflux system protein
MNHKHSGTGNFSIDKAFKAGIILNLIFIIIEVIFGFLSHSMALLADAGHNFSDVIALSLSWIAVLLSRRKPTLKFTYGLRRSTILIALLNTLLLLATVTFILWEIIQRLGKPVEINSLNIIIVASAGIAINGVTAWMFFGGKKQDLNIRSAFIHFLADAMISLGVVVAGFLVWFTGLVWLDSAVSFLIVGAILWSSYKLLIDSVNLALDAVPDYIDITKVRKYLLDLPEVTGVHDLHIWALSTTDAALTVHLSTSVQTGVPFIQDIQKALMDRYGIGHATIQVEFGSSPHKDNRNCNEY